MMKKTFDRYLIDIEFILECFSCFSLIFSYASKLTSASETLIERNTCGTAFISLYNGPTSFCGTMQSRPSLS